MTNLLFYLTFVLFSFGQLGRISFFGQQINIYFYELLLVFLLTRWIWEFKLKPLMESFSNFKVVFLFLVWLTISFLFGMPSFKPWENLVGLLYLVRFVFYWIYCLYLIYWLKRIKDSRQKLINSLNIFILSTVLFSALQYFFYPDLRNQIYQGWDPHLYRLFGLFFDTSVSGAIYGIIFLLLMSEGERFIRNIYTELFLIVLYLIFIVLTFSRTLYLALFATLVFSAFRNKLFKQFLLIASVFIFFLIVSPKPFGEGVNLGRFYSIESRFDDYKKAISIWKKSPIIGIGYNRIRYEKIRENLIEEVNSDQIHSGASFHSSFLIILVTSGVVGLVLFFMVLLKMAALSKLNQIIVLFLSLCSVSDNILLHPFILFILFTLSGLTSLNLSHKKP